MGWVPPSSGCRGPIHGHGHLWDEAPRCTPLAHGHWDPKALLGRALVGSLPSTASPAPLSLVPAATLLRVYPTPLSASLIRTLESTTPKDGGISPSQGQQQVAECLEVMLSTHPHPPLKPTAATQRGQCSLLSCPTTPAQSMSIGLMEDNWRVYNLQTL